jgi:hypothetical protein
LFGDLFAGVGKLGKAAAARGFGVCKFEAYRDGRFRFPSEDLSNPVVVHALCRRILAFEFGRHLHLGIPCTTWTVMQYSFVGTRTAQAPFGDGTRASEVEANEVMRLCLLILWCCIASRTGFSVENPRTSVLWKVPDIIEIADISFVSLCHCDLCAFGLCSPKGIVPKVWYKKPTSILGTFRRREVLAQTCPGNHCHGSLGRQEYFMLSDGSRVLKSRYAGNYTTRFAKALVAALV